MPIRTKEERILDQKLRVAIFDSKDYEYAEYLINKGAIVGVASFQKLSKDDLTPDEQKVYNDFKQKMSDDMALSIISEMHTGSSLLHRAAVHNNVQAVQFLLKHGADPLAECQLQDRLSAYEFAENNDHSTIIDIFNSHAQSRIKDHSGGNVEEASASAAAAPAPEMKIGVQDLIQMIRNLTHESKPLPIEGIKLTRAEYNQVEADVMNNLGNPASASVTVPKYMDAALNVLESNIVGDIAAPSE